MKASKLKIILIVDIILLIISVITYKYIFQVETGKRIYSEESAKFVEENRNPVFKIEQIILYSSANAIDNSNGELKSLDISQFTDIEIFIDNKTKTSELTAENTVNELFIDNIKLENNSSMGGEKIFNYKNPFNCGKYTDLSNWQSDGILFDVINSNDENSEIDYNMPVFYTDCSNPISLGYINKNILTNCEVNSNNASISFDGSILENAGIDLKDLNFKLSFNLHLINNFNEEFVSNIIIDNDLSSKEGEEGIYSGYMMQIINPQDDEYSFIKLKN